MAIPRSSPTDVDTAVPSTGTTVHGDQINTIFKNSLLDLGDLAAAVAGAVTRASGGQVDQPLILNYTPTLSSHAISLSYVSKLGLKAASGILTAAPAGTTNVGTLYRANTTTQSFIVPIPPSPSDGDRWGIKDSAPAGSFGTHSLVVSRIGTRKIAGAVADRVLSANKLLETYIYNAASDDWELESYAMDANSVAALITAWEASGGASMTLLSATRDLASRIIALEAGGGGGGGGTVDGGVPSDTYLIDIDGGAPSDTYTTNIDGGTP